MEPPKEPSSAPPSINPNNNNPPFTSPATTTPQPQPPPSILTSAAPTELQPPKPTENTDTTTTTTTEEEPPLQYQCGYCDKQLIYRISQELISALATACIDSTIGGIFRKPGSVAPSIRKELIDYLYTRSKYFVAETMVIDGGSDSHLSAHPADIISYFLDDFGLQKRNFFSRVSGWVRSDAREAKIAEFLEKLEAGGFWVAERREAVAEVLVRNVDFKGLFHCEVRVGSEEELVGVHQKECMFRPVMCDNEGCSEVFSAGYLEEHDLACDYKVLGCEMGCGEYVLRKDMDGHCVTVCPMKCGDCSFYGVGCKVRVPEVKIKQHCSESCRDHLVCVIKYLHKETADEDVEMWADKIMLSEFYDELAATKDVRSFTKTVKEIESKIGPFVGVPQMKEELELVVQQVVEDVVEALQTPSTIRSAPTTPTATGAATVFSDQSKDTPAPPVTTSQPEKKQ